jgi:hypothetical protein
MIERMYMSFDIIRAVLIVCVGIFILNGFTNPLHCQDQNIIAIIPPFMDRQHSDDQGSQLQLTQQRFVIFLYRNAAVVYSEADLMNTGADTVEYELALPSTGFQEKNGAEKPYLSNGILSMQMWVAGERIDPEVQQDGDVEWYSINTTFPPSRETKAKALFWVQTSLTDVDSIPGLDTVKIRDGKRGFLLNLSQAAIWQGVIGSFSATVVFKEGLTSGDTLDPNPDNYEVGDSTINWTMRNIEPSTDDNISLYYNSAVKKKTRMDTMKKLSRFIISRGYDEVLNYILQLDEE